MTLCRLPGLSRCGPSRLVQAVLLIIALILPGIAAATERRIALVIGNGAYHSVTPLANAPNDARLMAKTLTAVGFTLIGGAPQLDLDRTRMEQAIQEFGVKLAGADVALFYYAGHGVQVRGANYLVPISANPTREADVDFQMIDAQLVLRQLANGGSKLNMMILDACRNNPFPVSGMRAAGGGLAQMGAPEGTMISYATQPGAVAADGDDGNSPYTKSLTETMREPGRSIFDVFNQVGVKVKSATRGVQQPWVSSSPIEGSFYFVPPVAPAPQPVAVAPQPAPAAPAVDPDVVFWQSIASSTNPGEYAAYLQRFPNGLFSGLARTRMASLAPAKAVQAPTPAAPTPAAPPAPPPAPAEVPVQRSTTPPSPVPARPAPPPAASTPARTDPPPQQLALARPAPPPQAAPQAAPHVAPQVAPQPAPHVAPQSPPPGAGSFDGVYVGAPHYLTGCTNRAQQIRIRVTDNKFTFFWGDSSGRHPFVLSIAHDGRFSASFGTGDMSGSIAGEVLKYEFLAGNCIAKAELTRK